MYKNLHLIILDWVRANRLEFFLRIGITPTHAISTAQKMKFSIKDFLSDQIRRKLRIWSHLPKKSLMENFIFCAV